MSDEVQYEVDDAENAGGHGDQARHAGATSRKKRQRRRTAIIISTCVIVLLAATAGIGAWWVNSLTGNMEKIPDAFAGLTNRPTVAATETGQNTPQNILVLGSDSRISAGDPNQWAYGAQRTDTIMLVHIPADRENAYIISFPRDSWVDIPGHGTAKINAAFSWGGPSLLIQTIEQLTGVRIDHFAVADFESFAAVTDSLGGVEITVPEDTYTGGVLIASAGTHLMTGDEALSYVRQRKGLPGGDFDRINRQQNWMRAIMKSAISADTLSNPQELSKLLDTVSSSVAVDDGFSITDMGSLALSMRSVRSGDVVFGTIPILGTGRSEDGQSIVNVDFDTLDRLMDAVANDQLAAFLQGDPAALTTLGDSVR